MQLLNFRITKSRMKMRQEVVAIKQVVKKIMKKWGHIIKIKIGGNKKATHMLTKSNILGVSKIILKVIQRVVKQNPTLKETKAILDIKWVNLRLIKGGLRKIIRYLRNNSLKINHRRSLKIKINMGKTENRNNRILLNTTEKIPTLKVTQISNLRRIQ